MQKPFFSVIIPTFNCADKLQKSVTSVICQTFKDFELLIMDDGSTDDTPQLIKSFDDPRIIYEWSINSGGPATPRNLGIDKAQGKWICFLDADDIWYPGKLNSVYRAILKHPEIDVFCHSEKIFLPHRTNPYVQAYGPYRPDFYRILLVEGNRLSTSATAIRRIFLLRHCLRFNQSPNYVIVEDYDLWLRIALHGGNFFFINTVLGEYIVEGENISQNTIRIKNNQEILLRDHVFRIQNFERNKKKLWAQFMARKHLRTAKELLKARRYLRALSTFFHAVYKSPYGVYTSIKIWFNRQTKQVIVHND